MGKKFTSRFPELGEIGMWILVLGMGDVQLFLYDRSVAFRQLYEPFTSVSKRWLPPETLL